MDKGIAELVTHGFCPHKLQAVLDALLGEDVIDLGQTGGVPVEVVAVGESVASGPDMVVGPAAPGKPGPVCPLTELHNTVCELLI